MNNAKLHSLTVLLSLLFTLILILQGGDMPHAVAGAATPAAGEGMIPVGPTEYRTMAAAMGGGRRRLEPFQLCLLCKCCSGATCASMQCCFGIDCQLPNKPFGVCAFVPKTCNCTSCSS